jgi:drug/metabolite transporter (DMT)-like permease
VSATQHHQSPALASAAENRRGTIAMIMAMSLFICNDTLMKLAREVYPAGQAIALRTIFAVIAGFVMVLAMREGGKLRLGLRPLVLLRSLLDAGTALCFIWALGKLPLGNVTAIGMASPLLIVLFAVLLGIERVGWRRTVALIVGFIGVLIVVRPTAEGFNPAAVVALLSAVFVAARDLLSRRIGSSVPSTVVSLTATIVAGTLATGLGTAEEWEPIWRRETIYLAAAAVLVSSASLFIISAFRSADIGVISGMRYSIVIFAVIIGYLVWGDVPDAAAFAGMALIIGSGVYTMHRQSVVPDSNLKKTGGPPPA